MRLVTEIRGHCETNIKHLFKSELIEEEPVQEETIIPNIERRNRAGSFATRKISLTCETFARAQAMPAPDTSQQLLNEPKRSTGRLRSPAPSPIPSPVASPSPTRSRFQVSRVSESDSPVTPPTTTSNVFFSSGSRFKVTMVDSGTPSTVVTSSANSVTVGFDATSLSPNISVSPAPSPTPIPAPLLSSISSLFPTPMPSPMPSPLASPSPSPTYISPLCTINVGEALSLTPTPKENIGIESKSIELPLEEANPVSIIISGSGENKLIKEVTVDDLSEDIIDGSTKVSTICESVEQTSHDNPEITSNNEQSNLKNNPSRFSPRNSASPPKVCKLRSESEDSEKDIYINRKLPKATDSLDLFAQRVMKQPSVNVPEKPSVSSQRVRKISSWVQPSVMFSSMTQDDSGKPSSSLERLLGLFTNPFSRSKVEEEPPPQLECVPEVVESFNNKCDSTVESSSATTESSLMLTNTKSDTNLESSLNEIENLKKSDNQVDIISEMQTNCSIKDSLTSECEEKGLDSDIKSDSVGSSCLTRNGCEPNCDNQDMNISLNFNNNGCLKDKDVGTVKCETWPQGTTMAQLNLFRQNQSQSTPHLTALVFLKGNVASNLAGKNQILHFYYSMFHKLPV